ncbi:hypothetical protein ACFQ51_51300 [Streptomyces kaempferi]
MWLNGLVLTCAAASVLLAVGARCTTGRADGAAHARRPEALG